MDGLSYLDKRSKQRYDKKLDFESMSTTHSPRFVPQPQQKKSMAFNACSVTQINMKTTSSCRGTGLVPEAAKTGAHTHENLTDANDYMMLIKTQQESEHDYQSLQPRDQLSKAPDYDYTSSWEEEDKYQPLLLESIKPDKHSLDSTYLTLFSYPDP